jgi:HEAT repeat protein
VADLPNVSEGQGEFARDQVEMLIDQLASPDARKREAAAEALGELGDVRALEPLLALSVNDDSTAGNAAVTAVGRLGGGRALAVLQALIPGAETREPERRHPSHHGRGRRDEPADRFEALGVLITDSDPDVRATALAVVGELDDPRGMGLAIAGLRDGNAVVRRVAARVLGQLGTAVAAESLLAALDDTDMTVRCAVIDALGEIGDLRAAQALVAVAQHRQSADSDKHSLDREAACRALERLAVRHPGKMASPDLD